MDSNIRYKSPSLTTPLFEKKRRKKRQPLSIKAQYSSFTISFSSVSQAETLVLKQALHWVVRIQLERIIIKEDFEDFNTNNSKEDSGPMECFFNINGYGSHSNKFHKFL